MQSLNVYLVTYNCARTLIDVDSFAHHFFRWNNGTFPTPDLIVLSLQELAPLSPAFIGGRLLYPYFRRFFTAVNIASTEQYDLIAARNVGMTAIMILAKREVAPVTRVIGTAGVGVGHWRMGNKGAVGVRLLVGDGTSMPLTFVAAHLAPFENAVERRNQHWKDIVANLIFTHPKGSQIGDRERQPLLDGDDQSTEAAPAESSMFVDRTPLFFSGDLNYRTSDTGPTPDSYMSFPQPSDSDDPGTHRNTAALKEGDQLSRERLANKTLHHLEELPIVFPPTYKYADKQHTLWPSGGEEPPRYIWSKHRFPSWCDRILFSSQLLRRGDVFQPLVYDALPLPPTSDHRPVAFYCTLDLNAFSSNQSLLARSEPPFAVNPKFAVERAAARRLEVLVGGFLYLTMTWEGNALLFGAAVGAVGISFLVSSLLAS